MACESKIKQEIASRTGLRPWNQRRRLTQHLEKGFQDRQWLVVSHGTEEQSNIDYVVLVDQIWRQGRVNIKLVYRDALR